MSQIVRNRRAKLEKLQEKLQAKEAENQNVLHKLKSEVFTQVAQSQKELMSDNSSLLKTLTNEFKVDQTYSKKDETPTQNSDLLTLQRQSTLQVTFDSIVDEFGILTPEILKQQNQPPNIDDLSPLLIGKILVCTDKDDLTKIKLFINLSSKSNLQVIRYVNLGTYNNRLELDKEYYIKNRELMENKLKQMVSLYSLLAWEDDLAKYNLKPKSYLIIDQLILDNLDDYDLTLIHMLLDSFKIPLDKISDIINMSNGDLLSEKGIYIMSLPSDLNNLQTGIIDLEFGAKLNIITAQNYKNIYGLFNFKINKIELKKEKLGFNFLNEKITRNTRGHLLIAANNFINENKITKFNGFTGEVLKWTQNKDIYKLIDMAKRNNAFYYTLEITQFLKVTLIFSGNILEYFTNLKEFLSLNNNVLYIMPLVGIGIWAENEIKLKTLSRVERMRTVHLNYYELELELIKIKNSIKIFTDDISNEIFKDYLNYKLSMLTVFDNTTFSKDDDNTSNESMTERIKPEADTLISNNEIMWESILDGRGYNDAVALHYYDFQEESLIILMGNKLYNEIFKNELQEDKLFNLSKIWSEMTAWLDIETRIKLLFKVGLVVLKRRATELKTDYVLNLYYAISDNQLLVKIDNDI